MGFRALRPKVSSLTLGGLWGPWVLGLNRPCEKLSL